MRASEGAREGDYLTVIRAAGSCCTLMLVEHVQRVCLTRLDVCGGWGEPRHPPLSHSEEGAKVDARLHVLVEEVGNQIPLKSQLDGVQN